VGYSAGIVGDLGINHPEKTPTHLNGANC